MAIDTPAVVSVAHTDTVIVNITIGIAGVPCAIFNDDSTNTIYLGGVGVTDAIGFPVPAKTSASFVLVSGDILHGITASGTANCRIFLQGQSS